MCLDKRKKVISLYYSPQFFSEHSTTTYIIHRKIPPLKKKIIFFSDVIMYKTSLLTNNAQHLHITRKHLLLVYKLKMKKKKNLCGEAINYQVSISKGFVNAF